MRYDKKVELRIETKEYDSQQGKEITKVTEFKERRANVTDASQEVMQVAFGDWRKGTKVIRLLSPIDFDPTHIIYQGKKHKVATKRQPSRKCAFVAEEVTN